jgi:zinc/manganese transport system substrate-binding protein
MKKLLAVTLAMLAFTPVAQAALTIFACEPEWGSLAQEIGGDKVDVKNATNAKQDVHHIQARPSLIAAMRKADLVFCTGSDLEIGWLPILLTQTGNAKVQIGTDGSLMAADFVQRQQVPARVDRANGDVHPNGNPHIQMDPRNIAVIAKVLYQRLRTIDPANADYYQARYDDFAKRWQAAIQNWQQQAASLRGLKIAIQHNSWIYLTNWLGIEVVTPLEPKPGIPPSGGDLANVLEKIKAHPVKAVIYASYENPAPSQWLAREANIPAVELPFTVGGNAQSNDLFGLFDSTIALLKAQQ